MEPKHREYIASGEEQKTHFMKNEFISIEKIEYETSLTASNGNTQLSKTTSKHTKKCQH